MVSCVKIMWPLTDIKGEISLQSLHLLTDNQSINQSMVCNCNCVDMPFTDFIEEVTF